jgi:hypothetical protein
MNVVLFILTLLPSGVSLDEKNFHLKLVRSRCSRLYQDLLFIRYRDTQMIKSCKKSMDYSLNILKENDSSSYNKVVNFFNRVESFPVIVSKEAVEQLILP